MFAHSLAGSRAHWLYLNSGEHTRVSVLYVFVYTSCGDGDGAGDGDGETIWW